MDRTRPVPVRLDRDTRLRLQRAARRLGSNASSVIRLAIVNQLPSIERGVIHLAGCDPSVAGGLTGAQA